MPAAIQVGKGSTKKVHLSDKGRAACNEKIRLRGMWSAEGDSHAAVIDALIRTQVLCRRCFGLDIKASKEREKRSRDKAVTTPSVVGQAKRWSEVYASDLKGGDILRGKNGKEVFVISARWSGDDVVVKTTAGTWKVRKTYCVRVDVAQHRCDGCQGTGEYKGHGVVENGVFKGKTGQCFRCGGTGKQGRKDRQRNAYYDAHVRRIPV